MPSRFLSRPNLNAFRKGCGRERCLRSPHKGMLLFDRDRNCLAENKFWILLNLPSLPKEQNLTRLCWRDKYEHVHTRILGRTTVRAWISILFALIVYPFLLSPLDGIGREKSFAILARRVSISLPPPHNAALLRSLTRKKWDVNFRVRLGPPFPPEGLIPPSTHCSSLSYYSYFQRGTFQSGHGNFVSGSANNITRFQCRRKKMPQSTEWHVPKCKNVWTIIKRYMYRASQH